MSDHNSPSVPTTQGEREAWSSKIPRCMAYNHHAKVECDMEPGHKSKQHISFSGPMVIAWEATP